MRVRRTQRQILCAALVCLALLDLCVTAVFDDASTAILLVLAGLMLLVGPYWRWPDARDEYPGIRIPTLLVYGEQDWAPNAMRERDRASIPGVSMTLVARGGHFLSLDRPRELTGLILQFARARTRD